MEEKPKKKRRSRLQSAALVALGIAIGVTMMATPAMGHVGGTVYHLWSQHIKPRADARYVNDRITFDSATSVGVELNDGVGNDDFTCEANEICQVTGPCPPGTLPLNGGYSGIDAGSAVVRDVVSTDGWDVAIRNDGSVDEFSVFVYCLNR
jgi:hypothetical protein